MLKSAERNAVRGAAAQLSRFGGIPPSSAITSSTWRNFAAVTVWPVARSHRASHAAMATAQPSVRNLATLIMPWYAQYLSPALVEAQMPLLGLGYSVATAPLTPKT